MTLEPTMFFPAPVVDTNKWLRPGLMTSDSIEYYTPPDVVAAVLSTLGVIDLDPCADPGKAIPALRHFTEQENGLAHPWDGRVYMNPPYGRTIGAWTTKLRDELWRGTVTEAVALLPARVDTRWWHDLAATDVCFLRGRLRFSDYEQSAPFPSAAVYIGGHPEAFRGAFRALGALYRAVE